MGYFFSFFNQYNIIRHDIDFVDYNEIEEDDLVILGGSGMLYVAESFNQAINKILDICNNVIAWSVGYNTHNNRWFNGNADEFTSININKFKLITIRDYKHPSNLEYLPCPSAMALKLEKSKKIERRCGVICHSRLPYLDIFGFETINNSASISRINEFILTSEIIITNSYHCAYWGILLSRKVIVVNKFSTKFDYFKYKPEFLEINQNENEVEIRNKLEEAIDRAKIYEDVYQEAIEMNSMFFERVRNIIEDIGIVKSNDYREFYILNEMKLWNHEILYKKIDYMEKELTTIINNWKLVQKRLVEFKNAMIIRIIKEKTKGKSVAIKGAGYHTKKLLEILKGQVEIKFIIANEALYDFANISIISDNDYLCKNEIDIIILSSYQYRDSMRKDVEKYGNKVEIIDIYEELALAGCDAEKEFYYL